MAPTILIKFCGFTGHSKPNNVTLSAFPKKIPETEKNLTILCDRRLMERLTQLTNLFQFRYLGAPCIYLHSRFFFFHFILTVKLGVIHIRKNVKFLFSQKWLKRF